MTTDTIDLTVLTWTDIRELAEELGATRDIYDENGYADIPTLINRLGGNIERSERSEFLAVDGPGSFHIYVQGMQSDRRRRFAMTHGLATYFLDYVAEARSGTKLYVRQSRGHLVTAANVFASTLLMPEEHFAAAWTELDGDDWKLSDRFGVSPAAARFRGEVLGLVELDYSI